MFSKQKLSGLLRYAGQGIKNGFLHILVGNTLVKFISMFSSILIVRLLTKDQYGSLSVVQNILNYALLFNGLGMANAVLRYCSVYDEPGMKKGYFSFAVRFGLWADAGLVAILLSGLYLLNRFRFYQISADTRRILFALALTPLLQFLFDAIQGFFRANQENKNYSKTSVIFTACFGIFQVIFAIFFKLDGIVAGRYAAFLVTVWIGFRLLRRMGAFQARGVRISRPDRSKAVKYAVNSMFCNIFSLILPLNETLIVYHFVSNDSARADFNAATLAPASIQFITMSVIVFVFPYFAKNYKDGKWVMNNAKKLYLGLTAAMVVICGACIILTPQIIHLFFSKKYLTPSAVGLMRVFWVTFGINSALRMPTGNILASIGEIKFNLYNAVLAFTVHLAVCWFLVKHYGINGGAYGLLTVYALSSVLGIFYLRRYCKKLEKAKLEEAS